MLIFWTFWLVAIVIIIAASFGVAEAYAIRNNKPTLSAYIWWLSKAWPPFPFVAGLFTGLLIGGLAMHFWWGGVVCFVGCAASPVSP